MTKKEAYNLSLKIFGIVAFIDGVYYLPGFLTFMKSSNLLEKSLMSGTNKTWTIVLTMVIPIIYFIIAFFLIQKTDAISDNTMSGDPELEFLKNGKNESVFFDLIVRVLGIGTLLTYIPGFIRSFSYIVYNNDYGNSLEGLKVLPYGISEIVPYAMVIFIAVFLIYRSSYLVNLIYSNEAENENNE